MGLVCAEVELINGGDIEMARRHIIGEEEIRRMPVKMLVDTGCNMLAINERINEQLQLPIVEIRKAEHSDGRIVEYDVASQVELRFRNRRCLVMRWYYPAACFL